MSEIIHFHVGQCGSEIGKLLWNDVCSEHGIDKIGTFHGLQPESQLAKINVCFNEESAGKYQPRCIFTDLGQGKLDSLRADQATLFRNDNLISGGDGCGNSWPNGHYLNGTDMIDTVMDAYRKECEKCDCMQGALLTHSLGGGTGSGFGSLIMLRIREETPSAVVTSFPIFPSNKVSDCVVEPYNATLTIPHLEENCDAAFCIDNEALYRISTESVSDKPVYSDLNRLVSSTMAGVTSTLRFASHLNGNLLKLCINMAPFPSTHFFINGLAPIARPEESPANASVSDIIRDVFDVRNTLASCDPSRGRYLSAMAMFRGWASQNVIDEAIMRHQSKNNELYVEWLPDNLKTCVSNIGETRKLSATTIGNTSAVSEVFQRLSENFTVMFRRKAFCFGYTRGMDEMEMTEAISMLDNLISTYTQCDCCGDESTGSDGECEAEDHDNDLKVE